MDKRTANARKKKVLQRCGELVVSHGYRLTKPTFFTRRVGHVVEFVHAHKFRGMESFRLHLGIRVLGDPSTFVALNGPDSTPWQCRGAPGGHRYDFSFHGEEHHVDKAAAELAGFVTQIAEPWFAARRSSVVLLGPDSPLSTDAQACLVRATDGEAVEDSATFDLLGAV